MKVIHKKHDEIGSTPSPSFAWEGLKALEFNWEMQDYLDASDCFDTVSFNLALSV